MLPTLVFKFSITDLFFEDFESSKIHKESQKYPDFNKESAQQMEMTLECTRDLRDERKN